MKRILITGAAGFIGFHLAQALALRGDNVVGYDNFNSYYSPELKHQRKDLLKKQVVDIVEGDICDQNSLQNTIQQHQITHFVHLAAQAGVRFSLVNPQAYIQANITGFVNVLEACRHNPSIKLTYASSSSVYGRNTEVPFSIKDRVDKPASLYGVTKKTNELLAETYHHLYQIPVTGLRFFTVYGPWGRPDMAYFSFTKAILEEKPIEVYNFGDLQRDFTYIDDIIQGTIAAIDLGAPCELFNLGNNKPAALLDFIQILEQSIGKKAIIQKLPMQKGDVLTTYADINHSIAKLNFQPKTPLEKGIPKFVEWYKNHFSA